MEEKGLGTVDNPILSVSGGIGAFSRGMKAVAYIVDVNRKAQNTYKVRIPSLHGWCDIDGNNCEDPHWKNADLPTIGVVSSLSTPTGALGTNTPKLSRGDCVMVEFLDNEWKQPIIVQKLKPHATLGDGEAPSQNDLLEAVLLEQTESGAKGDDPDRGCGIIITKSATIPDNGKTVDGADKCGSNGRIKDGITANIADFLKIVQDTDGKIGSQFINKYTGELFSITSYVQKYISSILGVIRSSIAWIKAQITKYVRKAIDALVKLILQPVKGITKQVSDALEKALAQIACSFGDIESIIANLLESLLNSLVDSTLSVVFGCLDTLIDGILNEILNEALSLINTIIGGISDIAGLIGSFGDLIGEAIAAILDFLGISCGGAGDCTESGEKSFIYKFNTPGEYGVPNSVTKFLNSGLSAIDSVSQGIIQGKDGADAAIQEAAKYAAGVELGATSSPSITTSNKTLANALSTAEGLLNGVNNTIADFCSNASEQQETIAVVIGTPVDTSQYDSTYILTSSSESIETGGTVTYTITRNNTNSSGVVNFVAYSSPTDTVRFNTTNSVGDVSVSAQLSSSDFGEEPLNNREYPSLSSIFYSTKISFGVGEDSKTITIKTNYTTPPTSTTSEVTYTAAIFRSSDDITNSSYQGDHLPNSSPDLNTTKTRITFSIPLIIPSGTTPSIPPGINTQLVEYSAKDQCVFEGSDAVITITRSPSNVATTQLKVTTEDITAQSGVDYEGTGSAGNILTFNPDDSSASGIQFVIPTYDTNIESNSSKQFKLIIEDHSLPNGVFSNMGSVGTVNVLGQPEISLGSRLEYIVTITPIGSTICPPSLSSGTTCVPEIVITSPPPSCIVEYEDNPLSIGVIAKTTVPGYTLSYQWQNTYEPDVSWNDITDGSYSETVPVEVTTYGVIDSGVALDGNPYVFSGWTTSIQDQLATCVFTGSTTNKLSIDPLDYRINDQQYFRCKITATPTVSSYTTPLLSLYTNQVFLGVNADNVFASSVQCAPSVPSGVVITYSGYTAAVPGGNVPSDNSYCSPYPVVVSSGTPIIDINTPPSSEEDTTEIPTTDDGGDDASTLPTTEDPITPVTEDDDTIGGFPVVVVDVGSDGGVNSVPLPGKDIQYKFPPLISITGSGVGATAQAILNEDGFIDKILVKSRGFGYNTRTRRDLCAIIDSVQIQSPGGYYTSSPTVYVDGDSSIASAAIDDNGRVVEIRITNPQNKVFDFIPRIEILGGSGYGASAIAVLRYVDCATVADEYLNVVNKYNTSKLGKVRIVDCP